MRKIKNWLKKSSQIFRNTVSVAKLIIGTTEASSDSAIFFKAGGNYDSDYVFIWEPTVKPNSYSYLDLLDDGDDAYLYFHLKDYYDDMGNVDLDMDPSVGITLSQGNDKLSLSKEEVFLQTTGEIHLKHLNTKILVTDVNDNILLPSLPTSNPTVAGALWNDSGTLKISAG